MIKFIFRIFKLIFTVFIAFIVFAYIFSIKSDISFENTISYFKTIGRKILSVDNSDNIVENPDTEIIITTSNNNYYYEQLDSTCKIIYTAFENNIDNFKKENYVIDFSTTFNDLLNTTTGQYKLNRAFQSALDAFFYDHPELFYIDLTKISLNTKCISIGPLKTYTVEITPKDNNYLHDTFNSEQEVNIAINKVENIKNDIINSVSKYNNTYNKIKFVHDILVNSIEYNASTNHSHNIYGALVEKKVVCEGYAKTFKYIMDSLDIECILVSGTSINSSGKEEAHMWNYIKLNDNWYGVDVTWDDPIIIGGSANNNLRFNYLLKGYYTFIDSHFPSGKISDKGMFFKLPSLSYENFR